MNILYPKNFNGNVILIGPEIFGITKDMQNITQRFADNGFVTVILDFYQNKGAVKYTYSIEDRDKALSLFKSLAKNDVLLYIKNVIGKIKNEIPNINNIGYAGFSSGAYIGYFAAAEIPDIKATMLVSPGWITDSNFVLSKPYPPIHETSNIKGSILLIAGDEDMLVDSVTINKVKYMLTKNNIIHRIIIYPQTKHGFYIPSRKETYNATSTQKLWNEASSFFYQKFNMNMKQKILFVLTSHDKKGANEEKTGYYLGEVSHVWNKLVEAGYEIDFVSPKGGEAPVDGFDLTDSINKKFWEDEYYHNKVSHTMKPKDVHPEEYKAIYLAGGHGAMWDLPGNNAIAYIVAKIYERNGVVAAVCHGPAGLVNVKLSDGSYLIKNKRVNGFSDEEEALVKLTDIVPFLLEDKLKERGGKYEKSDPWKSHVTIDGRLITGQNPQSAVALGEAIVNALK